MQNHNLLAISIFVKRQLLHRERRLIGPTDRNLCAMPTLRESRNQIPDRSQGKIRITGSRLLDCWCLWLTHSVFFLRGSGVRKRSSDLNILGDEQVLFREDANLFVPAVVAFFPRHRDRWTEAVLALQKVLARISVELKLDVVHSVKPCHRNNGPCECSVCISDDDTGTMRFGRCRRGAVFCCV